VLLTCACLSGVEVGAVFDIEGRYLEEDAGEEDCTDYQSIRERQ
jgi:hypothetical protein